MTKSAKPILLFDGVCNMCDQSVQWVIRHDPDRIFQFASLQSEIGQELLQKHQFDTNLSTVVLIDNDKLYSHSDVPLEVWRKLGGGWSLLYIFKIIPPFLRNMIYRFIAKNRYRWFGKKDQCMLPTPDMRSRFL